MQLLVQVHVAGVQRTQQHKRCASKKRAVSSRAISANRFPPLPSTTTAATTPTTMKEMTNGNHCDVPAGVGVADVL